MNSEIVVFATLGVFSIGYAFFLNTKSGKKIADEHTWVAVVAGVALVLRSVSFIIPDEYWQKVVIAFIVAGIPMVARSLWNKRKSDGKIE
ncbi:MAG: hypothetical protein HN736_03365 [Anaerolineae bacterium]|jgi:hypothetical protein|nr:hypothetical protein [Anaerolineae bacterium]MBT4311870.1 hypothetical protein [Anaerolineae bacterium]MBT4458062.1 hypothetical protein [Anaerolineae bacterium]MBT6323330.1 hypothetical protein [Anaerolineae bacterium]MBT6811674.1 hypothetical protein [Anaerolineae bacterium]